MWRIPFLFFFVLAFYSQALAEEKIRFEAWMKSEMEDIPKTDFQAQLDKKIYLYIRWLNLPKGKHTLNTYWYNGSKLQDRSSFSFILEESKPYLT